MEGRSHNNKSYAVAGQVSRMARDFQICSDDFKSSFKPRPAERHRASLPQIERKQRLRVCVVGAGLAGLRFAQLLVDEGIDVTVFEARERIGGRVGRSYDLDRLSSLTASSRSTKMSWKAHW